SALADDHAVGRSFAIELRSALSETEERTVAEKEGHARRRGIEHEPLYHGPGPRFNRERWRRLGEPDDEVSHSNARERFWCARARDRSPDLLGDQLARDGERIHGAAANRTQADPCSRRAE